MSSFANALTCPLLLLRAHTLGLSLEAAWGALECAGREAALCQNVLLAVEDLLKAPCTQREVLRRLAGRFPVLKVKQALKAGVGVGRLQRSEGPRRSHRYERAS